MKKNNCKYIFVVGGVMSSVGKGIAAASIGKILQSRGYKVANLKADMYVNIDAGTIRPAEHGEVFVGEDGIEADQDLGNYERFTDQTSTRENYITTGQIYAEVIRRERNLEYEGEDVEVYPDIPKEIIRRIEVCQKKNNSEITIIEYGGTVGEYQLLPFLEAARMMKSKNPEDVLFVLISYLPTPTLLGEQKSKPTQRAVIDLHSVGLNPDFVICRADKPATSDIKKTINNVCSLSIERIISAPNVYSIYDVPVNFEKDNFGETLLKALHLPVRKRDLSEWVTLAQKIKKIDKEVKIGIVGKYFNFKSCKDTYISVIESINHASWALGFKPNILWLDSEKYEKDSSLLCELDSLDGIIVPGGFGNRGVEGMILTADYARLKKIPYFGLCLGMQIMTIAYARNILKLKDANSTEMDPETPHPVIATMADQVDKIKNKNYGATMRLGAYPAMLKRGSLASAAYGQAEISERHRHRYEVDNKYVEQLQKAGLVFSGVSPDGTLMEIAELPKKDHPFYLGTQFHPEFKSRPFAPHPLFTAFVKAAKRK
ncbi:CTP synthase [Candidatus Nomurabacteria bacterium RIFCSPHIGHO2_01_FULL_39_220]|uniref:CTP synthase (glutamine hydrolyzing) n=1 Tax=Candidatus Nomurabacteria bacterium RIFCSPLOWO2_02_FULL_40_67 TaxID=1801787 RepID=A0A1F6Y6Q7_9BACT|nr:MAG: CTP synthetase [Parcubacteria group bacterium GW2011_GWA2_40_37]OGG65882.1 MAG: CTP synthase [Candidatus Kaiserbacteria bacterium RIFCSPHIGHO2_12_45_16]OGI61668.1 MAG: CTP synthase [Candidatus Nomurabacteria bacterium RBG_16_40_11]OGI70078.1 MAG: CTP synthase [Candidatus Nomurabacteria bacterium RIFCSPHIGHO2_01_FULL_39_220]OGI72651.1 MAG: CTP synthase [Candidatus Nomurabacteria bacterium RIFCSPHIGHO2_02_41_18]OGI81641.1 MAG: CTP synthase [Candidatus Nomurabacteria bacterium RIFCSPHIGHO